MMKQNQILKLKNPIQFILLFAFASILPIMSILELVTTGSIDLEATGGGRAKYPMLVLYIIGWACFFFILRPCAYAARYQMRGFVFQIAPDYIKIGSEEYPDQLVQALQIRRNWRDAILVSDGKAIRFHPDWTAGGIDMLHRRYADKVIEA